MGVCFSLAVLQDGALSAPRVVDILVSFDDAWMQLAQLLGWTPEQVSRLGDTPIPQTHPLLAAGPREQPIQPLLVDDQGMRRFKTNEAIRFLLENGKLDLNTLAVMQAASKDREQLAQLIGYSVDGFGSLSYASDRVHDRSMQELDMRAVAMSEAMMQADTPAAAAAGKVPGARL